MEQHNFSIDSALNNPKFLGYLAEYPDAQELDMEDEKELQIRFEAFNNKEYVAEAFRDMFKTYLQESINIKLSPEDFADVDSHLEELAINSPEELEDYAREMSMFDELPRTIAHFEGQIRALGGNTETLLAEEQEMKDALGELEARKEMHDSKNRFQKGYASVMRMFGSEKYIDQKIEQLEVEELIGKYNLDLDDIDEAIADAEQFEDLIAQTEAAYEEMYTKIIGTMGQFESIAVGIGEAMRSQLEKMLDAKKLEQAEKAHDRLAEFRAFMDNNEGNIEVPVDPEKGQEMLDEVLEDKAREEIEKVIDEMKLTGGTDALYQKFQKFLEREALGSKDHEETKEFISQTIRDRIDTLGDTKEDKSKTILLNRLLTKLK